MNALFLKKFFEKDRMAYIMDWVLVGGQNGLIYFQSDNIGRVYRQTFAETDWFVAWRQIDDSLYWIGEHAAYEVLENRDMPGFLQFQLCDKF